MSRRVTEGVASEHSLLLHQSRGSPGRKSLYSSTILRKKGPTWLAGLAVGGLRQHTECLRPLRSSPKDPHSLQ